MQETFLCKRTTGIWIVLRNYFLSFLLFGKYLRQKPAKWNWLTKQRNQQEMVQDKGGRQ
jgi:hypothetical protein